VNIIILLIAFIAVFVILWLLISRRPQNEKPDAYVCDQCGETHCDCHKEDSP